MKIFQLIQKPQERGAELFASLLSEELFKRGHEVILISIFDGKEEMPFSGKQIHLKRSLKNRLWDLKAWKDFADLVKKEKPDLIQANAGDTLKFAVFSRKIFGWETPIVFRNASMMSLYISSPWVRKFNSYLLRQVEGITSVSKASQEDMNSVFELQKPILEVIPIGILPSPQEMKDPNTDTINLVHIGGFTFEKNHLHLLDIFEGLLESDSRCRLTLIGNGPLWETVKKEISNRRLEDKVMLMGSLKNPFSSISSDSILLLTSKIEGLPSVILEAMFHKIPVVAYGVGGIPEILKNGETGWCISPEDKIEFIRVVQEVVNLDPKTKNRITENAYLQVHEKFTLEKIANRFEEYYRSILNS